MGFAADNHADAAREHQSDLINQATTPTDWLNVAGPTDAETAEGVEGGWRIDGDRMAAWALRRIGEHRTEIDRVNRAAEVELDAIRAWAEDSTRAPKRSIEFLEAALIDYRRRLEADNPRLPKTYRLPGGDLVRRAGRVSIQVVDEDALVAWAERNAPDVVRRHPVVTPLKGDGFQVLIDADGGRVVTDGGEVVPGVTVPAPVDSYTVRVRAETPVVEP